MKRHTINTTQASLSIAFSLALAILSSTGNAEVAAKSVESKTEANKVDAIGGKGSRSSRNRGNQLIRACRQGNYDLAMSLIQNGADVNFRGESGITPLMVASENGHIWIVQGLLKRSAKTDLTDNAGMTPLHLAALNGYTNVGQMLLDLGSKIGAKDKKGRTPLQIATERGKDDFAKMLTSRGAK